MRVLRSIAATLVLAAIVVGVPVGLIFTVGNPAVQWPALAAGDISDQVVLAILAVIVWIAWAQFTLAMLVELASGIRRAPVPRRIPGVFAAQQHLARTLVTAVLMLAPAVVSAVSPAVTALTVTAPAPAAIYQAPPAHAPSTDPAAATPPPATATSAAAADAVSTRRVQITPDGPHTWWDLAAAHTGDGRNWSQLWQLNAGRPQPGGGRATETGLLRDGWDVLIPDPAANAGADRTAAPAPQPAGGAPARAAAARHTPAAAGLDVTVQPGHSLAKIATEHHSTWPQLWQANKNRAEPGGAVLDDPNHIEPGWRITIPTPPEPEQTPGGVDVTVQPGDSLAKIATEHHSTWPQLWQANKNRAEPGGAVFSDPNHIEPGWIISIPTPAGHTPAPAGGSPATGRHHEPPPAQDGSTADAPDADEPAAPPPAPGQQDHGQTRHQTPPATPAPDTAPAPTPAPASAPAVPAAPSGQSDPMPPATAAAPAPPAASPPPAETPATSAPTPAAVGPATGQASSTVTLITATGGGLLLAGLLYQAAAAARRRGLRWRRSGRAVRQVPEQLVPLARQIAEAGPAAAGDAAWLAAALRHAVSIAAADPDGRLPDVIAARLSAADLQLVLARPAGAPAPAPWRETDGGLRWTVDRGADLTLPQDLADRLPAPFPALATVGHTDDGARWLLDLEMIGAIAVAGDHERGLGLLRYLAAELVHNVWSDAIRVSLVGLGQEMASCAPGALDVIDPAQAADRITTQLAAVADGRRAGVDVAAGRLHDAGDFWVGEAILAVTGQAGGMAEALAELQPGQSRAGLAAVTVGDAPPVPGGWVLHIAGDGRLTIPELNVSVIAEQLPVGEAGDLAALLAMLADTHDTSPRPAAGEAPWDAFADETGQVRDELADPEPETTLHVAGAAARAGSVLPLATDEYAGRAAVTPDAVAALAPIVDQALRVQMAAADPDLDVDVAAWRDDATTRPRITLLGPVGVRAAGTLDSRRARTAWNTELVAYLATRQAGVSPEKMAADLWPDDDGAAGKPKLRKAVSAARRWLGPDHLPANPGGTDATYQLRGALVDAQLFRRLRIRAAAKSGADGIADLQTALDLVTGRPFDALRLGGYGWLAGEAWDHTYVAMITDAAHTVATHHLAAGDGHQALAAAQVALRAGCYGDEPLLDCAAACRALGMVTESSSYIQRILHAHDAEIEEDLPPATYQVLCDGGWIAS